MMMVSAHGGLEQGAGGRGVHDGRGPLGRHLQGGPEQLTDRVTGGGGRRRRRRPLLVRAGGRRDRRLPEVLV